MNVQSAVIKAVCISEKKGQQKHPIESIHLRPKHSDRRLQKKDVKQIKKRPNGV